MKPQRPPTDMRRLRRDTNRRMLWMTLFVLVGIGGGLIAVTYGANAALVGSGCLLAGAGLIGLLWFVFTLIGKWAGEE
jgi:protein-S-isoprenylcysteine O-methyltransferase Ste14